MGIEIIHKRRFRMTRKNKLKELRLNKRNKGEYTIFTGRTVWKKVRTKYPIKRWAKAREIMKKIKSRRPRIRIWATHRY